MLLDKIEFLHPVPEGVNTEIQLLGGLRLIPFGGIECLPDQVFFNFVDIHPFWREDERGSRHLGRRSCGNLPRKMVFCKIGRSSICGFQPTWLLFRRATADLESFTGKKGYRAS